MVLNCNGGNYVCLNFKLGNKDLPCTVDGSLTATFDGLQAGQNQKMFVSTPNNPNRNNNMVIDCKGGQNVCENLDVNDQNTR